MESTGTTMIQVFVSAIAGRRDLPAGFASFVIMAAVLLASSILAADPAAYVVNASGETLSKINVRTGEVSNDILQLGSDIDSYPNQIVIRDTLAYVTASGSDEMQIINLNTNLTAGWVRFEAGDNPYWTAFLDDTTAYVTLLVGNCLAKVNMRNRQVVKRTAVGLSPEGVVLCDGKAYVAVTGYDFNTWSWGQGKVAVYDVVGDTIMREIKVEKNPQFLAMDRTGRIHVVCTGDYFAVAGTVYVIDPSLEEVVDSIAIGGQPGQIAIGPDDIAHIAAGGWSADGEVYAYHCLTGQVLRGSGDPIPVDSGAVGIAAFGDSSTFVACFGDRVVRLDGAGAIINRYGVGDGPGHLDFNYLPGDANGDWLVDVGDAVFIVNYIFKGGERPPMPYWRANPNGDEGVNVGDAVALVNYLFKGGARPQVGPTWLR